MRISREQKFGIFWLAVIAGIIIVCLLFGCSKKKDTPSTYSVTYEFYSAHIPYQAQIWDVTNKNDFSDSIKTNSFSKTITYDYQSSHRCGIFNAKPCNMKISINWGSRIGVFQDSLYPSLEGGINP